MSGLSMPIPNALVATIICVRPLMKSSWALIRIESVMPA
jgi:hypothetical protein